MTNRYSISDARNHLPAIVHRVEQGNGTVELTRRGKPVAVILSIAEYKRLTSMNGQRGGTSAPKRDLYSALMAWRASVDWENDGIDGTEFEGLRDQSPGRDVNLR